MISDDYPNDPSLARLASLRTYDVNAGSAERLRRRCHVLLEEQASNTPVAIANGILFRRIAAPVLGGAWCVVYLIEVIRRAVAVYGM